MEGKQETGAIVAFIQPSEEKTQEVNLEISKARHALVLKEQELEKAQAEAEAARREANQAKTELNEAIKGLREFYRPKLHALAEMEDEMSLLRQAKDKLEETLRERSKEIERSRAEHEEMIEQLRSSYRPKMDRLLALEEEKNLLLTQVEQLKEEAGEAEKRLHEGMQQKNNEMLRLRYERDKLERELAGRTERFRLEAGALREYGKKKGAEIETLNKQAAHLVEETRQIKERLEQSEKTAERLRNALLEALNLEQKVRETKTRIENILGTSESESVTNNAMAECPAETRKGSEETRPGVLPPQDK